MPRRSAAPVITSLFGLCLAAGCASETKPDAAPATNGVNYGENKVPTPDQVRPKGSPGPRGPGAPPVRN